MLGTAILLAAYSLGYRTEDSIVLFLPGLIILSILLSLGIARFGSLLVLLPLVLVGLNLSQQNRFENAPVREPALDLLITVPEDAVLITPGDQTIAALWYFQTVEGMRPDTVIVDNNMFQFDWYRNRIGTLYPDIVYLEKDDLRGFIDKNSLFRPICLVSLVQQNKFQCLDK
jgi:hypothetical protein